MSSYEQPPRFRVFDPQVFHESWLAMDTSNGLLIADMEAGCMSLHNTQILF